MTLSREQMLVEMGISPLWVLRESGAAAPAEVSVQDTARLPDTPPAIDPHPLAAHRPVADELVDAVSAPVHLPATVNALDWSELQQGIKECRACPLCQQRKQAVPGVGDTNPDWLFIGEGPGAEEDVRGEPFVGQAGKLLDAMLDALDMVRGNKVYIANAVKCRPPGNRTPEAAEMAACRPWLERQIALLKPKIIVLLGKAAVHSVLKEDKALSALRGQRLEYAGIPVVVTYHPAYLLRNLPDKAKVWEDLLLARRVLREVQQAGRA